MKYQNTIAARFIDRLNRFLALVDIDGKEEAVHVKNTGRCKELLLPGVPVILAKADAPTRKTKYDLIAVEKEKLGWVNIDSQAPNQVVQEWLWLHPYFDRIQREYTYGDSRIDFYMEKGDQKYLLEVKGCTLEIDGVGYFPDAPTERGVKHLRELIKAQKEGYKCGIAFVIQMNNVDEVRPNDKTHPEFGKALSEAIDVGVRVFHMRCWVRKDTLDIIGSMPRDEAIKIMDDFHRDLFLRGEDMEWEYDAIVSQVNYILSHERALDVPLEEQVKNHTKPRRPLKELEAEYNEAIKAYQERFGEILDPKRMPSRDACNIPKLVKRCIETNTPYKYPPSTLLKSGARIF